MSIAAGCRWAQLEGKLVKEEAAHPAGFYSNKNRCQEKREASALIVGRSLFVLLFVEAGNSLAQDGESERRTAS